MNTKEEMFASSKNKNIFEYRVTRNGVRVSDKTYPDINEAKDEADYWKNIISKWPDGSVIEIVPVKG